MRNLVKASAVLLLLSSFLSAQNTAQQSPVPNKPAEDYSGMYAFLQDGEFVQVTVEDAGRVTGFVSRYGDLESDRGVFLDQFFKKAKLDGKSLSFTTDTVHGIWYEFKGTVERGEGKNVGDEAYYVLKGTLLQYTTDANKKTLAKSREVSFKSFPQDMGTAPEKRDYELSHKLAQHSFRRDPEGNVRMLSARIACILACLIALSATAQESEDLNFASGLEQFQDISRMLPSYLNNIGLQMLTQRQRQIEGLATIADVGRRRAYLRQRMLNDLGGFPERTPLNARVVGVLQRPGYRIEKVIFESQPHFYVTANLYLPTTGHPPYPAILFPLGHEPGGKTNPTWQQMLGSLATKGFVALTWDPIGQGERLQIYDEDLRESKVGDSTTEHTVVGAQCLLLGEHLARYTIWDGMRALDYLLSRPEVDPKRVGLTGNSGGGTHTAYIAALDDRIQVAAPSCYITSWRLMLQTIGPQDAEQTFPFWLQDGLDYPDYLYAFAPKPYLLLSAIRDFFPIAGARETFAEAARVYSAIGAKEKLGMFEADDGHGYNKTRRLAAYEWFGRWLKGVEDKDPEPQIEMATPEELRCTPTGQVSTSLGGESIFTLNQKRLERLKANRGMRPVELPRKVQELIHYEPSSTSLQVRAYGTISRPGYHIEKLTYESEPGITIPSLLFVPDGGDDKKSAVLMVSGDGKKASAPDAEHLVTSGMVVLSIDARGFGETANMDVTSREFGHYFGDFKDAMTALLVGKTMVGMRALDITRGVDLLSARQGVDRDKIYAYGNKGGSVPALYAAVLDRRIRKVVLEDMLSSYDSVVENKIHRQVFETVVPGALKFYDLPDLVATLAPREVSIVSGTDPLGHELPAAAVQKEYIRAVDAYRQMGMERAIHIRDRKPGEDTTTTIYRELRDDP